MFHSIFSENPRRSMIKAEELEIFKAFIDSSKTRKWLDKEILIGRQTLTPENYFYGKDLDPDLFGEYLPQHAGTVRLFLQCKSRDGKYFTERHFNSRQYVLMLSGSGKTSILYGGWILLT